MTVRLTDRILSDGSDWSNCVESFSAINLAVGAGRTNPTHN